MGDNLTKNFTTSSFFSLPFAKPRNAVKIEMGRLEGEGERFKMESTMTGIWSFFWISLWLKNGKYFCNENSCHQAKHLCWIRFLLGEQQHLLGMRPLSLQEPTSHLESIISICMSEPNVCGIQFLKIDFVRTELRKKDLSAKCSWLPRFFTSKAQ